MTTCIPCQYQNLLPNTSKTQGANAGKIAYLDEGLDLAPLGELLRTHALGHLEGVALDAGDDGVGVWPLLGALIELLDDDDLLPRLAALENDRDLAERIPI